MTIISSLVEQMIGMNSFLDKIYYFVKRNVLVLVGHKKNKKFSFFYQLSWQPIANTINMGQSLSSKIDIMNCIHVNKEAVETTHAIANHRSCNKLLDPWKDHLSHKNSINDKCEK